MQHAHFLCHWKTIVEIVKGLSRGQEKAAVINNETSNSLEDPIDQRMNVCNEHVSLTLMLN